MLEAVTTCDVEVEKLYGRSSTDSAPDHNLNLALAVPVDGVIGVPSSRIRLRAPHPDCARLPQKSFGL
jgi:hypothetical protein